ncbi:MAG: hypothetical protein R2932_03240 [Caldilineaceae bacterium]
MTNAPCPYLYSRDGEQRQRAPVPYPSFENSCQDVTEPETLLLTDQATFCLSGSHTFCPRYQALVADGIVAFSGTPRADFVTVPMDHATRRTQEDAFAHGRTSPKNPPLDDLWQAEDQDDLLSTDHLWSTPTDLPVTRWYPWLVAGLLFFAVIAVGSVFAAYAGWQLALDRLATARSGEVQTLAAAAGPVQPIYLVMTATSESAAPVVEGQGAVVVAPRTGLDAPKAAPPTAMADTGFPQAVTATPVIVVPLPGVTPVQQSDAVAQNQNSNQPPGAADLPATNAPGNVQLPPLESTPTPVPIINVELAVPTRRPTPEFDIPTSTAEAPTATLTETPIPIVGTPIVIFGPDESSVPPGECTKVRWHVENVRAVYYESQAAFGDGDHEECIKDESDSYALTVILANGQTQIYTTTVGIIWPTPTPSVTPSFTPEIIPTETWTPLPPTATPTPDVVFGTTLAIAGDNPHICSVDSQCTIGVLATNSGDTIDTLAIDLVAAGDWPALICNQVGTCSDSHLVIPNVGPANTVFANLQLTIPADSGGQEMSYALRAVSEGSGGSVVSQVIELKIESSE